MTGGAVYHRLVLSFFMRAIYPCPGKNGFVRGAGGSEYRFGYRDEYSFSGSLSMGDYRLYLLNCICGFVMQSLPGMEREAVAIYNLSSGETGVPAYA